MTFDAFFNSLTQHPSPRTWQSELAATSTVRSRLIRRVTGDGKTEGVLLAWIWNAVAHPDERVRRRWPRRLVWCLPMRVLVEQTVATARELVARLPAHQRPGIAVLMGGEDMEEWFLQPHCPYILIGTQDMLLSRSLNRGYGSGRARWPVEFGLLNRDSLWVMDEVQLMDVGLATSGQLQAYRDQDATKAVESVYALKPSFTWWMSATLQPDWLKTVDTETRHGDWTANPSIATAAERKGGLWEVSKSVQFDEIEAKGTNPFADRILEEHSNSEPNEFGRITLVVCNTVDRAVQTFAALKKSGNVEDLRLVHSRFRQAERESWRTDFLNRNACKPDVDRIIVATQVVEAGVDISATTLVTELAPWPSLVQRFGRCARYGGAGAVVIVDRGHDEKTSAPYEPDELANAWSAVQTLPHVGTRSLEEFEEQLDEDGRAGLYAYEPQHLLMRGEFDELFDTTPDLSGADLDISRFIRSGDERDVQVFWAEIPKDTDPDRKLQPQRRELCSVPFLKARDWLCGKESSTNRKPKLRGGVRAWTWDFIDGDWKVARREDILPGRTICVDANTGGYTEEFGFSLDSGDSVEVVRENADSPSEDDKEVQDQDRNLVSEALSFSEWKSIAFHTDEVVDHVEKLCEALELDDPLRKVMRLAARWHDIGKAHPAFQGAIEDAGEEARPERNDLAKGPQNAWRAPNRSMYRMQIGDGDEDRFELRPSLRHELASALAMFSLLQMYQPEHAALLGPWADVLKEIRRKNVALPQATESATPEIQQVLDLTADEFDLLIYLIASHHGKVRIALHASPTDQDYSPAEGDTRGMPIRGIRTGDELPAVAISSGGQLQPTIPLSLEPASLGLSPATGASWRERCEALVRRHSPTTLATVEAILRAADVAASCSTVEDPEFAKVAH